MPFLLIFFLLPFIEIGVFIWIGGEIGLMTTLAITFLTAIIGGGIIKYQGLHTVADMQNNMQRGALPVKEIFDGFCLVAAGAFLITPGFVTDTLGFFLLIPPLRDSFRNRIKSSKHFHFSSTMHGPGRPPHQSPRDPNVIEGEYERVEDEEPPKNG